MRAGGGFATKGGSRFWVASIILLALFLLALPARGQDLLASPLPLPENRYFGCDLNAASLRLQQPENTPDSSKQKPGENPQKTSKDRILWTLPNFLTMENAGNVPPLTPKEKFKVTARGLFDPFEFVLTGFVAGLNQASNSDPSYGQGMQGYGKRYGTAYGDNFVENFMASAVLPSLLHQDPRYFQLGHGGFFHRAAHAVGRILITRSDSGRTQLNFSELGGGLSAAAISTYTYHPGSERDLHNVISVWGTQLTWDAATYVIKEFWPDLRKKRSKRHDTGMSQGSEVKSHSPGDSPR